MFEENLVMRKATNVRTHDGSLRENLFQMHCHVYGNVWSLIINGDICANISSTYMVNKMNLLITEHPQPCHLQWFNKCEKVTKQVLVPFSMGKYHSEVWCDVVPIQESHIILGQPLQFNCQDKYDVNSNHFPLYFEENSSHLYL